MATQATLDAHGESGLVARTDLPAVRAGAVSTSPIHLSLYDELAAIEQDWRAFEQHADCTVFQTFDWLSAWQRNIGVREGVTPAILVGRQDGEILFILPLATATGGMVRRLIWLGTYLCNYNGPLLARDFPQRVDRERFARLWREIQVFLRGERRHDVIDLEKMPEMIGSQVNPLLQLLVTPHVNDAYLTTLTGGSWDAYYAAKRSSSTRKTDRKKRKRLAEFGEIQFITADDAMQAVRCVDALIEEKRTAYADLGVANMFEWPGYRDFFIELATSERGRALTHVSRLDIGATTAAANFGLVFRGRYYYVLAGYGVGEYSRFGPGSVQLHELLGYSIARGLTQFDFTIGDEPYKREWSDTETRLFDQVSPATVLGWAAAGPIVGLRLFKRWAKRSPTVWPFIRKMRAKLGSLRR